MTTLDSSIRFWNKIAPGYAERPIKNEAAYQEKLAITRSYCRPEASLLELGCGTGKTAVTLAPEVGSVLATDFAPAMVALGEAYAKEKGVENIRFEATDAMNLNHDGHFDIILAHSLTHLLKSPDEFLVQVRKLLADDGVFMTNTICLSEIAWFLKPFAGIGRRLGWLPQLTFFTYDEYVAKLARAGFQVERCYQPGKGTNFIVARPK